MSISIRTFREDDWAGLWPILRAVFAAGDTYTFAPDITEADARAAWTQVPAATFVACDAAGRILGSYYLKANQPGHGDHVANCGYVVSAEARGRGIASAMCMHSQAVARERGFLAMQFNFVASTNTGAVRLWQALGFDIVGTLPSAFRHPEQGFVDAYVMYRWLGARP